MQVIIYYCNKIFLVSVPGIDALRVLILNNIGCAYRRTGKLKKALMNLDEV